MKYCKRITVFTILIASIVIGASGFAFSSTMSDVSSHDFQSLSHHDNPEVSDKTLGIGEFHERG